MKRTLSQSQIIKYAARLHGKRLLPVMREWQIKRAIVRLACDGSQTSLDAIKQGVQSGLLGKHPYSALLEFVLAGSIAPSDAKRVRAHLRPLEPIKQPEPHPPRRDWTSGVGPGSPTQPAVKAEPESFSTTNNPIQLLREQLKTSAPLESYRTELRERVRRDNSRKLLQEICELWDRSVDSQKEMLRELIEFIELVPERPLWLRRNVALDCGMPWQLADDSPAIAQYLVDIIQLRTRKKAILSACRKLLREDTRTEILDLWFGQYKQGVHDKDFDDVLLQIGVLPKEPLEQRVAIALTCGWAEKLAYDDTQVLAYLLPLLDHPRLGAGARRALENIKNPSTLKALEEQRQTEAGKEKEVNTAHMQVHDANSLPDEASEPRMSHDGKNLSRNHTEQTSAKTEADSCSNNKKLNDTDSDQPREEAADRGTNTMQEESGAERPTAPRCDTEDKQNIQSLATDEQREESAGHVSSAGPTGADTALLITQNSGVRDDDGRDDDDWEETASNAGPGNEGAIRAEEYIQHLPNKSLHPSGEEQRCPNINTRSDQGHCRGESLDDLSNEQRWDLYDYPDFPWIKRLDHYVMLEYEERLSIIAQIASGDKTVDEWIDELLYRQVDEQVITHSVISNDETELADILGLEVDELLHIHMEDAEAASGDAKPIYPSLPSEEKESIVTTAGDRSPLESLYLDDLAPAALDSASVFLVGCASEILSSQAEEQHLLSPSKELIAGLLTFHTRERSAEIKDYEEAMESNQEALRSNSDCIAGAYLENITPYKDDVYAARYRFDPQQSFRHSTKKGKDRPKVICQQSHAILEIDAIDNAIGITTLLIKGERRGCIEHDANFIYIPPDFSLTLRQDLAQQAPQWIHGKKPLPVAFNHLLQRSGSKRIEDLNRVIAGNPSNQSALLSDFLRSSNGISLVIQGPPGSGKTSCAAEVICDLAKSGLKIGVSANSHLAIDTLLSKASSVANATKQNVRIAKYQTTITSEDRKELVRNGVGVINKQTFNMLYDVYGGTVHAFSKQIFAGLFDLLVIDEASQVPLASLLAMARCARNILLIGDQQQLAQPIGADHPGESGLSCLGYATANQQVVDSHIGIFLSKSWRMHPNTCDFISSTFYEQRLLSHQDNSANSIVLSSVKNGILYIPVEHDDNHVVAVEEAEAIKEIISLLIGQKCSVSQRGKTYEVVVNWEHIAIMSPYNAQVSLIQRVLGPKARVGTVDRFQGQEAPISIYSLTTSQGDNPSALEFVLNRNRVNVALSRSQCLSILIGSPSLTSILNSSPELSEARELFFSLIDYIGTISALNQSHMLDAPQPCAPEKSSEARFLFSQWFEGPNRAVPLPDDLRELSSIKQARKLFKFSLDSTEILKLYHYRLFDELALFLEFCSWDKSEKPWEQTKLLIRLAASPNATPLLLVKLAKRGEWKTREAVAANPNTPLHVVKDLIGMESVIGRRGAAQNPQLPEEIYWDLSSDPDELVGRSLASNPTTPKDILHRLTESAYEITSRLAQENLISRENRERHNAPGLYAQTISDPMQTIHSASPLVLASDPSTPASVLSNLVSSIDQKVRTALASNPSISSDDIHTLAFDSNDAVRIKIAVRRDLPSDVMTALAFDQSRFVRRALAENPTCTEDAYKRLVSDSDVYVRERVACQVSLPERVCCWLLAESEARVIIALADNANVPTSYFKRAQIEYYSESLTGSKPTALKGLLLVNKGCPVQQLSGVNTSWDPAIRLALALSPHVSASPLQSLQNDDDSVIRNIATRRLSMLRR